MLDALLIQLGQSAPDTMPVDILQPVDPFLESVGEEMRRRIFITVDLAGQPLCLRPEFTIPLCLAHTRNATKPQARYAYGGTVFRQERAGSSEFLQAGLEDLGRVDSIAADADCLADLFTALDHVGASQATLVLGDQTLFGAVVDDLQLPTALANRLTRAFGNPDQIEHIIAVMESETPLAAPTTEAEKLAVDGDLPALTAHVEDLMATASLSPKAGRSAAHIAERMIARQSEASFRMDHAHATLLRDFLNLSSPLQQASEKLARFAKAHDINFGAGLDDFVARHDGLMARGVPMDRITYRASFGRNLDYYSGLLFDAYWGNINIAGGGRYDHLCTMLGSPRPVPAVGFSISLDRVEEAAS